VNPNKGGSFGSRRFQIRFCLVLDYNLVFRLLLLCLHGLLQRDGFNLALHLLTAQVGQDPLQTP